MYIIDREKGESNGGRYAWLVERHLSLSESIEIEASSRVASVYYDKRQCPIASSAKASPRAVQRRRQEQMFEVLLRMLHQ